MDEQPLHSALNLTLCLAIMSIFNPTSLHIHIQGLPNLVSKHSSCCLFVDPNANAYLNVSPSFSSDPQWTNNHSYIVGFNVKSKLKPKRRRHPRPEPHIISRYHSFLQHSFLLCLHSYPSQPRSPARASRMPPPHRMLCSTDSSHRTAWSSTETDSFLQVCAHRPLNLPTLNFFNSNPDPRHRQRRQPGRHHRRFPLGHGPERGR